MAGVNDEADEAGGKDRASRRRRNHGPLLLHLPCKRDVGMSRKKRRRTCTRRGACLGLGNKPWSEGTKWGRCRCVVGAKGAEGRRSHREMTEMVTEVWVL